MLYILDSAGKNVAYMRLSVSGRRAVIKDIRFAFFSGVDTFFKDIVLFPKVLDLFFSLNEVQISVHFFVHFNHSFQLRLQ
mgnify:CR=1 FL=1